MKGVVLALAILALGFGSAPPDATTRAALRLTDYTPLTIRGTSFKPRERVRVTFRLDGQAIVRQVRATLLGRFTTSAGVKAELDRCGDLFLVSAVGSRGSRASLKAPQPDCPPSP